jgi:hypothetical protein
MTKKTTPKGGAFAAYGQMVAAANVLLEGYYAGKVIDIQTDMERDRLEFNARQYERELVQIDKRTQEQFRAVGESASSVIGSQKAVLAGQNIDLSSEVAQVAQEEVERVKLEEMTTIKNNAFREAMGVQAEISGLQLKANTIEMEGKNKKRAMMIEAFSEFSGASMKAYKNYKSAKRRNVYTGSEKG